MENQSMLYPFKFNPIFKTKVWGGSRLPIMAGQPPKDGVGENWILSAHGEDDSLITNGFLADNTLEELIEVYMDELVGDKVFEQYQNDFPLLFKLIDAHDDLSIQVHPNDEIARKNHGPQANGKAEMWYVMQAEPGAKLVVGFKNNITQQEYDRAVNDGTIEQMLQWVEVKPGDVVFIPPGVVHAIGKGILLAEIQQSSDITYRIHDYNRRDKDGNLRPLHIKEAQEVVSLELVNQPTIHYSMRPDEATPLVQCEYFTTNLLSVTSRMRRNYQDLDSFVVLLCTQGKAEISAMNKTYTLTQGELLFVPASLTEVLIQTMEQNTDTKLLETYIP